MTPAACDRELRCNRAHGLHMFEHRLGDAEAEFAQTIRERPTYGTAYVRSALMYATLKRFDKALDALEHGSQVEPLLADAPCDERRSSGCGEAS